MRDWRLVGRQVELAAVAEALADRETAGVVFIGEGGVGKTRLAEECLRIGVDAGYSTARVTATRGAADIPLGALAPLFLELGDKAVNLLSAARSALAERAGGSQLLLMVDDAHLLDDVSAALLLGIASDRQVFVIATLRAGEAVPDAITALWKDGYATRIDVMPLAPAEVDALAESIVGGPLDVATAMRFRRLSGGNALAMRELVLASLEGGTLTEVDGIWHLYGAPAVPPRLAELVGARLGNLDDDERRALELLALGEPLTLDVLFDLASPGTVDRLEERELVARRREGDLDEVWLSHPLHGDVLRERMPALRRRRCIEHLAGALEAGGQLRPGDELRLAVWRLELGDARDEALLLRAARRAFVVMDLERTVLLARAAWSCSRSPMAGHLLGHALCQLGRHDEAEAVLAAAVQFVESDEQLALMTMARTENLFRSDHFQEAIAVNEAAEAVIADDDWRAELAGHRATLIMLHGDPGEALRLVQPMLAGRAPRPFIEAAIVATTALALDGQPLRALAVADRAAALHRSIWTQELFQSDPGVHLFTSIIALIEAGRFDEAEARARKAFEAAHAGRRGQMLAAMTFERAGVHLARGHVATARRWYRQGIDLYGLHGPVQRRRLCYNGLARSLALHGDAAEARAALEAIGDSDLRISYPHELLTSAWVLTAEGQLPAALDVLDHTYEVAVETGARGCAMQAIHTMARLGRPERAIDRVEALAPGLEGELHAVRAAHVRALVARDGGALTAVAQRFATIGAILEAAEAYADSSRLLARQGAQRAARSAAQQSRSLAAMCQGATTPALALSKGPSPLTTRERDIALLASRGLATRDIAARLGISGRTVDNHLQAIYQKLGISGRDQLGSVLSVAVREVE